MHGQAAAQPEESVVGSSRSARKLPILGGSSSPALAQHWKQHAEPPSRAKKKIPRLNCDRKCWSQKEADEPKEVAARAFAFLVGTPPPFQWFGMGAPIRSLPPSSAAATTARTMRPASSKQARQHASATSLQHNGGPPFPWGRCEAVQSMVRAAEPATRNDRSSPRLSDSRAEDFLQATTAAAAVHAGIVADFRILQCEVGEVYIFVTSK
ncbi:hypothetical protein PANT_9c00183 [Moesziomyces antarcticus T-34]|uniref:Uncharacterized protein n=1 Tax=Pseudozyma antarctica (strain T-34) TaxID=1151754 RepID=M9LV80_PSEA3|nr:hypothetical protein PANT_9c00183 [Moesziomyces antarcticus T-34]